MGGHGGGVLQRAAEGKGRSDHGDVSPEPRVLHMSSCPPRALIFSMCPHVFHMSLRPPRVFVSSTCHVFHVSSLCVDGRPCVWTQVSSLNDVPLHYLKPNSLVKFRCLVQDMFDPEFYLGVYETVDPSTNAKVRFKDRRRG